jgi:hypothetical protein
MILPTTHRLAELTSEFQSVGHCQMTDTEEMNISEEDKMYILCYSLM